MGICEHDNGEIGTTLSGTCIKCGADLDKIYVQRRMEYIEERINKLEEKLFGQDLLGD